jgi:hypothetical protein
MQTPKKLDNANKNIAKNKQTQKQQNNYIHLLDQIVLSQKPKPNPRPRQESLSAAIGAGVCGCSLSQLSW